MVWNYRLDAIVCNPDTSFYGWLTSVHGQIPSIIFINEGIWTVGGGMPI